MLKSLSLQQRGEPVHEAVVADRLQELKDEEENRSGTIGPGPDGAKRTPWHRVLRILNFGFVSDFDVRVSSFRVKIALDSSQRVRRLLGSSDRGQPAR